MDYKGETKFKASLGLETVYPFSWEVSSPKIFTSLLLLNIHNGYLRDCHLLLEQHIGGYKNRPSFTDITYLMNLYLGYGHEHEEIQ